MTIPPTSNWIFEILAEFEYDIFVLKNSEDIFCAFTTEQQKLYGSFGKAKH
jgi:hypothetical protein